MGLILSLCPMSPSWAGFASPEESVPSVSPQFWNANNLLQCDNEKSMIDVFLAVTSQPFTSAKSDSQHQFKPQESFASLFLAKQFLSKQNLDDSQGPQPDSIAFAALAILSLSLLVRRTVSSRRN
ncbi:MAG: hypothetical protein MI867_19245 [Pseudomonadales bacterium]|nr:hypothetical protein [Pseudomonadales bacterium]